jgi:glycosyltransferase involved in cell wall biosynthesis
VKVLIYQQFHPGHHYVFIRPLLPALLEITPDVVVAVTAEGRSSIQFEHHLAPFADRVLFDPSLPDGHKRVIGNERLRLHTDLRDAVRHHRPDYVFVPSGDPHTTVMGAFRLLGAGGLPGRPVGEVGIHGGRATSPRQLEETIRGWIDAVKLCTGGWKRLHFMNFLFRERLAPKCPGLLRSSVVMPNPVEPNSRLGKAESRERLGLPKQGRLFGIAGVIDYRKAVAELLTAFSKATSDPDDRIVLAGGLHESHRRTIDRHHRHLVDSGRLIIRDEFLDATAYQTMLSAFDVVCVPYPGFTGASSVLIEGLVAGRPVLTDAEGWCHEIVTRFGAGWSGNVRDENAFAATIRVALSQCESYRENEATTRLLAFNTPENYTASWLQGVTAFAGLKQPRPPLDWSWVLAG